MMIGLHLLLFNNIMSKAEVANQKPILIYFSFRGRAQAIRSLLCYLKASYWQYLVDDNQHNQKLPSEVLEQLKPIKLEKEELPALIHNGLLIYNQEQVMAYLCKHYQQLHLLGTNIHIRARLQELVAAYLPQVKLLFKIYDYAVKSLTQSEEQTDKEGQQLLEEMLRQAKYVKYYCQHLSRQTQPKLFILGEPTFLDFIFMESCEFMLGLFNKPERIKPEESSGSSSDKEDRGKSASHYMEVIVKYSKWMTSQPFYVQNREYLESFSTIMSWMSADKVAGMRKIWLGNPQLIR